MDLCQVGAFISFILYIKKIYKIKINNGPMSGRSLHFFPSEAGGSLFTSKTSSSAMAARTSRGEGWRRRLVEEAGGVGGVWRRRLEAARAAEKELTAQQLQTY